MKKILFVFGLLCILSSLSFAQDTTAKERAQHEVNQIEKHLISTNAELKLQEAQKLKLENIIIERENKKILLAKSKSDKNQFAKETAEIDKEYRPAIQSILTKKQLDALSRSKRFQFTTTSVE